MPTPIRIAIVGLGKIARDQHIPVIARNSNFQLVATVSPRGDGIDAKPHYRSLAALLAEGPKIDAVALCTPPQVRYEIAAEALGHGLHVFLEKPPGATLSEVVALEDLASTSGATLFASWHSRYAAGVEPARAWLKDRRIDAVTITWREDVRIWHPGQAWIWEAGGLGVFDPGVNALSIVTRILPRPVFLQTATLSYPANRAAPIAAELKLRDTAGSPIVMDLDWRQTGPQTWDIVVETDAGVCKLSLGGSVLDLPSGTTKDDDVEYVGLYARFADLIARHASDVDLAPMRLVADAVLRGDRKMVEAFED